MSPFIGGGGLTCASTLASIVHASEVLLADVVAWSIDCATKLGWAIEARLRTGWVVLGVTVGACNDHLEIPSVLALVDSCFRGHTRSPECALYVGERWWFGASLSGSKRGVALEVDVECSAEVGGIAQLLALDGVIGPECVQTHV